MAEAPSEGSSEIENAITMAWAIFALVVVLIVIALMGCSLTALSEPGRFETRTANMAKRCFIHAQAARAFHRALWTKTSAERELCTTDSIAVFVILTMAARKDRWAIGCTHAQLTSSARSAELLRPGAVLDYPEWNLLQGNAGSR